METIRTPRRRQVDLIHGPIFKNLFIFAIPIFISNLFQQLYNAADAMIVATFCATPPGGGGRLRLDLRAAGGFGLGIGNGLAIVTARAYGAEDAAKVKKTVAGSVVIGLAASAIITVVGLLFLYPLLEVLDTPPESSTKPTATSSPSPSMWWSCSPITCARRCCARWATA